MEEGGAGVRARLSATLYAALNDRARTVLPLCALMLLCLFAWNIVVARFHSILVAVEVGAAILCVMGLVFLARSARAVEEREPRKAARVWLALTGLWCVLLFYASVAPGRFEFAFADSINPEKDSEVIWLWITGIVLGIAWFSVLALLVSERKRGPAVPAACSPRALARIWLEAATISCAVLVPFFAGTLIEVPVVLLSIAILHGTATLFLRALPGSTDTQTIPGPVRWIAIWVLRAMTLMAGGALCASMRVFHEAAIGLSLSQAGLALLGGTHIGIETLIRELPRGGRTLWLCCGGVSIAGAAILLMQVDAPRRALFELYRGEFEACASGPDQDHLRVGPWEGHLVHDAGGGAYFMTYEEQMGSDPYALVAGFAYRPSPAGFTSCLTETTWPEFVATLTSLEPLGGEWYQFQASEHW